MPDWYRTHSASPEAYPDREYTDWAQDNGLRVDAAGNVTDPAEYPSPVDAYRPPLSYGWEADEDPRLDPEF